MIAIIAKKIAIIAIIIANPNKKRLTFTGKPLLS